MTREAEAAPVTATDTAADKTHLVFLARMGIVIATAGSIWLAHAVAEAFSAITKTDIEKADWWQVGRWVLMAVAVTTVITVGYLAGRSYGLWSLPKIRKKAEYSSHPSTGGHAWSTTMKVLFGLLAATALVLLCVKLFTSFMRDLEASGNTMSTRYAHVAVPQGTAQTPAAPQVQRVTAPPLAPDGKTNWSAAVHRRDDRWFYLFVPDSLTNFVERRVDGVVTNFNASAKGRRNEFRSLTNEAVVVRWVESERRLTPEERALLEP